MVRQVRSEEIKKKCLIRKKKKKTTANSPYSTVFMCSITVPKSPLTSAGCAVALLGEEAISL